MYTYIHMCVLMYMYYAQLRGDADLALRLEPLRGARLL